MTTPQIEAPSSQKNAKKLNLPKTKKEEPIPVPEPPKGPPPKPPKGAPGKDEPPEDYDPYVMRTGKHLTKNWEAWVNLVKSSVGAGLMGMPAAFKNAGMILGLVSTILIGVFCMYVLQLLLAAMYEICRLKKIPVITYQDAMKEALLLAPGKWPKIAKLSGWTVEFFLTFYQLGILSVYMVFISHNVKAIVEQHYKKDVAIHFYMLPLAVLLMCLIQIRNMKLLAPVSTVANLAMLFGLSCIFYYIAIALPPISEVDMFVDLRTYPLYLGTVLFALEAVAVIISVENNMRTPKAFPGYFGVLNLGMFVVVFLYIFVGFFGFWRYRDDIKGSITLNLAPSDTLAQVAKGMFSFAICLTFPLQAVPCVEVIWLKYLAQYFVEGTVKYTIVETFVRIGIVLFSLLLACTVPDVGKIISLIGSFCLSMLAVGFPPVVHLFTFYPDRLGKHQWMLYKDVLVFLTGLLVLCIGVYTSIYDLST